MLTRSKSKTSAEIQAYIDQVIETLASKEDINSLNVSINYQNHLIKSLDLKVPKLEEEVEENNLTLKNLEDKVRRLEGKQKFLNKQDDLRCRKIDNLEQYGRRECLRFDGLVMLVTLNYQLIVVRLSSLQK